ncbi:MAG: PhzF family phenazine biosynthesis protein [Halobacteriota archaeon]|uniref:PhzF family phenazine biosynthesis protein n=1 Tax=Natronomonas sp. TaxID=2184060 RepID=UPI0039760465
MDTRRAFLVDAFATDPLSGNPAGLVPDAEGLSTEVMAAIARELHASETAFLTPSDSGGRRIRYFTPAGEIDLCGHATVAAVAWLAEEGRIGEGTHTFETNVGPLETELDDETVWLDGEVAEVTRTDLGYDRIASALGADPATLTDIGADLPLAVASTGLKYLVVPMNFLQALSGLEPDLKAIDDLSAELDVTGVYAFTFDTLDGDSTLHARMFAPRVGIEEDPVTGTASGAVAAYLREFGAFDGEFPDEMAFEQGHFVDRPGRIRVRGRTDPIAVGGQAVTALHGRIAVPAFEDDEIIEV